MLTEFHIGIDDTDSNQGGCTTYTAALIVEKLVEEGFRLADFPWLVRLNPNIPWKTRGNGALAVHLRLENGETEKVEEIALEIVEETSDLSIPSTDPAVVFLHGHPSPELRTFAVRALHEVIRVSEAQQLSRKIGAYSHTFGKSRGIVGALAAIGSDLEKDHTFEIIAYRTKPHIGTPRKVDPASVREMDSKYKMTTFNNLDQETGRVLICSHGPDPVLFAIRGEDPLSLLQASAEIRVDEPVERAMLFKTNHGTDAHLRVEKTIDGLQPYQSAVVIGRVETVPKQLRGGHVVFQVQDRSGSIDCAAYEPTGEFRKIALQLMPGDLVKVLGGVRRGPGQFLTLNLEKLEIVQLAENVQFEKPRCPYCNGSCESMGKGQGFRCRKCGCRFPRSSAKKLVRARELETGIYMPPPRAHRHLTKPMPRYRAHESSETEQSEFPSQNVPTSLVVLDSTRWARARS